jgi:hypothetical protein
MVSFVDQKYDTLVTIKSTENTLPLNAPVRSTPALTALAHLLGRQAAAHVQKYRFEGLGRLQLIMYHIKSIEQI